MRYADGGGLTAAVRAKREAVRFEAAEMFEQGIRPPEVADRLRVSRKSVCAWHAAAQQKFCDRNSDWLTIVELPP
ncbi:helix-turn-helix domain-containing protein [Streptomyces sp. NPDC059918]|uniref:helix-turn-helix domain-containing protein n=1 Tax=unclassified Streptomyces TaxID=2593676 RepID=UPI003666F587